MSDDPTYPKVEVIRDDEAATFRQGMRALRQQYKEDQPRAREEAAHARAMQQYGIGDALYLLLTRLPTREGQPDRFKGEVITGLPDASMSVRAEGESPDDVIFEARYAYYEALQAAGVERDPEAARARAAHATYNIADIVGL